MALPQAPELPHGIEGLESYPFDFSFLLYVLLALAILGLVFLWRKFKFPKKALKEAPRDLL